jgi:GMP synthase (glutamine-hydrolysing) A subunit
MIKAVIFDMDGLMIDSEPIQSKSFEMILKEHGHEPIFHDNGLVQKVGLKSKENWEFLKERHGFDEDTDTLVEKKRKVYIDILKENIKPMPGLFELIKLLKEKKVKLAVASSSNLPQIELVLQELGIFEDFDIVVSGEWVEKSKPHPEIYILTAKQLEVEPKDCVALEDSIVGVISASEAGVKVIAVPTSSTEKEDFSKANLIVRYQLGYTNNIMIIIIDFGSQTAHLISRRIRELGQTVMVVEPEEALTHIAEKSPAGIVFSGGPASVFSKTSPTIDAKVYELGIPILGICYGQQLIAYQLKGDVKEGKIKEFGPAKLERHGESPLFEGISEEFAVWMNHGDEVKKAPAGFKVLGKTKTIEVAAIGDEKRKIYALQFHPEVVHTQFGEQIFSNFLKICGVEAVRQELDSVFVEGLIDDIRESLGNEKAICALSGGVDSSVAALLVHKAIGENLTCFYIDSGLMRDGETDLLREVFKEHYDMKVEIIDAEEEFLKALDGVTDPETKRKAIGETFIRVFEKEAKKLGAKFLVQGTIYPDVIESQGTKHSENIKSHHNVGGLPDVG